jgi:hypothetical protein
MVSEIKRPPLWKGLDPPLGYIYIVVQCGLSSIVEYATTICAVDCVKYSGLNVLSGALQRQRPDTKHMMYHFCSLKLGFVVSRYLLDTLGDSHYIL